MKKYTLHNLAVDIVAGLQALRSDENLKLVINKTIGDLHHDIYIGVNIEIYNNDPTVIGEFLDDLNASVLFQSHNSAGDSVIYLHEQNKRDKYKFLISFNNFTLEESERIRTKLAEYMDLDHLYDFYMGIE